MVQVAQEIPTFFSVVHMPTGIMKDFVWSSFGWDLDHDKQDMPLVQKASPNTIELKARKGRRLK